METFFILLFVTLIGIALYQYHALKREDERKRIGTLKGIADKVQYHLDSMNEVKTMKAKQNNCNKALKALHEARQFGGYKEVFGNYNETVTKLESLNLVLPIVKHLNKADKNNFKGKDGPEKNALLDALYEIENNNITDEDFIIADIRDDNSGEIVTVTKIEKRLKELGWER